MTFRRIVLLSLALLVLFGCKKTEVPEIQEKLTLEFLAMGGIPIHVTAWNTDQERLGELVARYRKEVLRLEAQMSVYRANSLLTRANHAGGEPIHFDADTAKVVSRSLALAQQSNGAFDPTVGPLVALWRKAQKEGRVPTPLQLSETVARVGFERVSMETAGTTRADDGCDVTLATGTALDVGGIAKGYFADVGLSLLRKAGYKRALVEIGGDLSVFDDRNAPEPFRIGVRHPFDREKLLGVVEVSAGAVVTSGDYERGFEIEGRRYNHIIDPRDGRPTEGVHSVTLLAPEGAQADALATAVVVMGAEKGLAFVEAHPELEAILAVDDAGASEGWRVLVSSGLTDHFQRSK